MKSIKLNFKSVFFACLAFFLSNIFCTAQAPMYVAHRIESEILKYEIQKLDTKDANYKSRLAELKKKEAAFNTKATNLEDAILKAFEAEQNGAKSPIKVQYNGVNIEMISLVSATTGVRPRPGPLPCQGGACKEFFILAQKCDWKTAKAVKQIIVNGTTLQLFLVPDLNGTMTTERHQIDANSSFSFSRI